MLRHPSRTAIGNGVRSGQCELLQAASYPSFTLAEIRPRPFTGMPCELAQSRYLVGTLAARGRAG